MMLGGKVDLTVQQIAPCKQSCITFGGAAHQGEKGQESKNRNEAISDFEDAAQHSTAWHGTAWHDTSWCEWVSGWSRQWYPARTIAAVTIGKAQPGQSQRHI
mmetsp:Transcript_24368/g.36998  ORF Transcript_24368/g.36998 Transcript_24368/m.36998 type:complete len:102 (-) Transcript_24368:609-914(-)